MQTREHIGDETLLDYIENRANLRTSRTVAAHLATGCSQCHSEYAYWSGLLNTINAGPTPATPRPVLERAFALFAQKEAKPSRLEQIVASLRFDSRVQPGLSGIRDGDRSSFKLLYEAPNTRIDLLCEREGAEWSIAGQVLSLETADYLWKVLAKSSDSVVRTDADLLGEFHLRGLTAGEYDLFLQERSRQITLPYIQL